MNNSPANAGVSTLPLRLGPKPLHAAVVPDRLAKRQSACQGAVAQLFHQLRKTAPEIAPLLLQGHNQGEGECDSESANGFGSVPLAMQLGQPATLFLGCAAVRPDLPSCTRGCSRGRGPSSGPPMQAPLVHSTRSTHRHICRALSESQMSPSSSGKTWNPGPGSS